MSIRKNLEYLRKQKKLSQEELAYKLGVSRQAVSKWESGAAFPETEKMMSICKIFDCSLDDLINGDIAQLEIDKDRKYTFNDLVNEVTDIVSRTFNMFDNMTLKSIFRFGFEMIILFLIILLLHIPFSYLFSLGNNVLQNINGNISNLFISIWKLITEVVYIVVAVVSFVYIYKIRFLDKFEIAKKEDRKPQESKEEVVKEEIVDKKGRKVEIRRYDFGLFSFIGKVALFFIKCFTAFISLPIIFLLFASVASVLIGIVLMFNGVIFIGVIIFLLSLIVFTISLLYILYNFIVNHRSDWQKIFIFFVACVVGFGIGAGLSVLEFSKMKISNEAPKNVVREKKEEIIEMKNNYVLQNIPYDTQYIVDETLGNHLRIEIEYYDEFTQDVKVETYDNPASDIYVSPARKLSVDLSQLYTILINDLKEKTISDYSALGNIYVKVYASELNINKLKENIDKRINMIYEQDTGCGCLE
ncbi:helix-turn-helix domain-containing protein [Candidatus Dojkabacteria bacterium]|uniref:Helix-turn-helix domain-containing protein n=1 Tax=Candidatus Dojkabacteria bacterium TaxID=2099670 RepID=A0A847ETA9_9BACT|nr:helix-turn-helix domain-containing protein [Candidatus Dojkabacteria bacterium]